MSGWKPPPGLDVPPPRRVAISTVWVGFMVLIFGIFLVPLATILPTELASTSKMSDLRNHGIETVAQVDKEDEYTRKGGTNYVVTYHYRTIAPPGMPDSFSGRAQMSTKEYIDISIGGKIPIIYDSRNPSQSTTETQLNEGGQLTLGLILAMFIVGPVVMTVYSFYKYSREKKLLQWGNAVPAKLIGEEEYSIRGAKFSTATYEFKDGNDTLITGIRTGVPTSDSRRAAMVELRARICLNPTAIYDPQNSARNMLYPPSIAKLL